ncbi:MAG TPA: hypothetical protein VF593_09510 [Chthoniobacteraceae bacterium]
MDQSAPTSKIWRWLWIGLGSWVLAGLALSAERTGTGFDPPTSAAERNPAESKLPAGLEPAGLLPAVPVHPAPLPPGEGTPLLPDGSFAPAARTRREPVFALELLPGETFSGSGLGPATAAPIRRERSSKRPARNWIDQTTAQAEAKSAGCLECHKTTDAHTMHSSPNVVLGCTDCHGGDARRGLPIFEAHVQPLQPEFWTTSANPQNSTVALNHESPEFIRFVNPGDLRAAQMSCGPCHGDIVDRVGHSMMNHGAMLWNAAAYNNGAINLKNPVVGQVYGADGIPLELRNPFKPSAEETRTLGILPTLGPLHRFNVSQPGNVFRIFEKGQFEPLQLGIPALDEPPGRPERRLSARGLGTLNRTDPVFLGAQKTRLHDPLLGFLGSNDRPGDYRSSGCSACHVVYANDRSPTNSGWWCKFGNQGLSFSKDPTISKRERGHPILHQFTRAIPSSQCMNCHMHQGNSFVNPYLGYTWWDQETDGEHFYPKEQRDPSDAELVAATMKNPEAAAARGLWGDRDFLEKASELNPKLNHTQMADYHGHGWLFRGVFKQDRKGNRLDLDDNVVAHSDFKRAVHLKDIHLTKGMQCVDCHFQVDVHGNGNLYGEARNAMTIQCIDCHGTVSQRPRKLVDGEITMPTSGPAGETSPSDRRKMSAVDLMKTITPWKPRFEWEGDALIQNSTMSPDIRWIVPQTMDVVDPASAHYNVKARYAKTLQRDGVSWGGIEADEQARLAHSNQKMDCQICHTSWATSCFGCHLPMKANQKVPLNKYEGVTNRNYTTYNPQVVRDDVFMLGIDGTVKKNRLAVIRSSSAVVVGSQNQNREWIYSQAQTVSAEGYSGQAFNPHFAHTTSGKGTTKNCTDCHLSKEKDNNAWMAQLLGFGTGTVNFFGRYAWVGGEGGLHGVAWTEADEPQAAIGSSFHQIAYPRNFAEHVANQGMLKTAYEHGARAIHDLTLRGEYLYTANGSAGLEVFDVAQIDQKGFSERIVSSPVSPLGGQRTYVRTKDAASVAMPSTLLIDPMRTRLPENEEQPIHPLYRYVFVADRKEGLVVVDTSSLTDGNPANNFLRRVPLEDPSGRAIGDAFNPDGKLTGAQYAVCAGHRIYVCTTRGLAVIDVSQPNRPRLVGELADGFLRRPRSLAIQFQYAFITDEEGLKVVSLANPEEPRPLPRATVPLRNAGKLYVARTYVYVANGPEGLAIIDVEKPERPRLDQMFNARGVLNDTRAVQIGSIAASMYALVADGHNGLRVLQLISPDSVEGAAGFSPRPAPRLIATFRTKEPTLAVSRGLDRDRVVDETGHQTVVFGRRGSRPFRPEEMSAFLRHGNGALFRVENVRAKERQLFTSSGTELQPSTHPNRAARSAPAGTPLVPQFMEGVDLPPLPRDPSKPGPTPREPQ